MARPGETVIEFAKRLGAYLELRVGPESSKPQVRQNRPRQDQILSYVFVLDFESTCWPDKRSPAIQEIIEFSGCLLNLQNGKIVDEFKSFVEPQEHPNLSAFCTKLTGITQADVSTAMPLRYVMRSFKNWVDGNVEKYGLRMVVPSDVQAIGDSKKLHVNIADLDKDKRWTSFITWSDWDLNVCLYYECNRKGLSRPSYLSCWADLRAIYAEFYERRPDGLAGALKELGLNFQGREHCGLEDARNTAILAYRLVCDGCLLNVTKKLDK